MMIITSLPAGKAKKNFRVGIFGAKNLGSVGLGETEDFFFKPKRVKKNVTDLHGGNLHVLQVVNSHSRLANRLYDIFHNHRQFNYFCCHML